MRTEKSHISGYSTVATLVLDTPCGTISIQEEDPDGYLATAGSVEDGPASAQAEGGQEYSLAEFPSHSPIAEERRIADDDHNSL